MSASTPTPSKATHVSGFEWDELSLLEKLKFVQAKRARYEALAVSPRLSTQAVAAARSLARSYAAAESLCRGVIEYEAKLNDRAEEARLMRCLGITPLDG